MFCTFSTGLLLSVVNECEAPHNIQKFHHFPGGEFSSKCNENLEISVLNAVQELNFSKFARLQPVTVLEIELHSFLHCFSAVLQNAYFEHFSRLPADNCFLKVSRKLL